MYPINSENSSSSQNRACDYSSGGYNVMNQGMYNVNSGQYQNQPIAQQYPEPTFTWNSQGYPYVPLENVSNKMEYEASMFTAQIPHKAGTIYINQIQNYNNQLENSQGYSSVTSGLSGQNVAAVVPTRTKRNRTSFIHSQVIELENEFHNSRYLSRARRIQLAQNLNLTEKQIKVWFQNRRIKYKKENGICSNPEIPLSPAVTSSSNSSTPGSTGEISKGPVATVEPQPSQSSNGNTPAFPQWNTSAGYSNQNDVAFQGNAQAAYVPPIGNTGYNVENSNYPPMNMQGELVPMRQSNENSYYSWDNFLPNDFPTM